MEYWKRELYEKELYHHGILGMKWGVRRYQNQDGTLTAAGKRKAKARGLSYDESTGKVAKGQERAAKAVVNDSVANDYKKASAVSNAASSTAKEVSKAVKNSANEDRKKEADGIDLSNMSDAELQRAVNRMNLEKAYRSLSSENIKNGKDKVASILSKAGDVLAVGASAASLAYTIYKIKAGI